MSEWNDCQRCERYRDKWGLFAPEWPEDAGIVVVSAHASRLSQAIAAPDASPYRTASIIRASLGLEDGMVAIDTLAACGRGMPTASDVAACGERIGEKATVATPMFVVLLGKDAVRLATDAGYLMGTSWMTLGRPPVTAILAENARDAVRQLVDTGQFNLVMPARPSFMNLASEFVSVLGRAEGRAVLTDGKWKRERSTPLARADVEEHLAGRNVAGAFRPKGPWPFVVVDVDVHNALQQKELDHTMAQLRAELPNSFVVQSSDSGGRHVYVRLPPDTRYDNAALWLRGFLVAKGLRFLEVEGSNGTLRSELTEVPNHPPRLPFGTGSRIPGSDKPLAEQAQRFLDWVRSNSDASDFEKALVFTRRHFRIARRWSATTRARLKRRVERAETGEFRADTTVPVGDPWSPILASLPKRMRGAVTNGIPSYGTRTSWTQALVAELSGLVSKEEAYLLMEHWLLSTSRSHASEDLERDPALVLKQTRKVIKSQYRKLRGVPVRLWTTIEADVRSTLARVRMPNAGVSKHARNGTSLPDEVVLATAFFIARGFYQYGRKERRVPAWEFAQFAGRNRAHAVQAVLTEGNWLQFVARAVQGEKARTFALSSSIWPAWPLEKTLMVPPFPVPRRRER